MNLREAVDLVYEAANHYPEGSRTRTALRMVARAAARGQRITSATIPAMTSAWQSIAMARGILSIALEDGGKLRPAAREAHDLLANAIKLVAEKLSRPSSETDDA
ncbi:MAG: hypothetical protein M3Q55_15360 [Acidobacteriota bacterium]|nr:hypothetical protein [Acidobacteriota bacterium]